MSLEDFLNVIGGEYVKVLVGNVYNAVCEGDKNAIRMHHKELLERNVINVGIASKSKFEVLVA